MADGTLFVFAKGVPFSAGLLVAGGKLFFYEADTTDKQNIYTTADLSTPHSNPVIADANGKFPAIFLDPGLGDYKYVLAPAADTDPPTSPIETVDDYPSSLASVPPYYDITPAEIAAGVTPVNTTGYEPGDVSGRYGTNTTPGTTDMTAAWGAAIAQASEEGGAPIKAIGTYLVDALTITTDGVKIVTGGMGPTTLLAKSNNINVLKVAASYCEIGSMLISGNGKTGVHGLVLAPADETDTAATTQTNFNKFGAIQLLGCTEGIRMRAGPSVGSDSGCFYNDFDAVWVRDCIRSVWMQDSIDDGSAGPNANIFKSLRCGSSSTVCNTGLQIDMGAQNKFYGVAFEGINNAATPSAIPTAVIIADVSAAGPANEDNEFHGLRIEACTRSVVNANATSQFFGGSMTVAPIFTANPKTFVGFDVSLVANILPGYIYQTNGYYPLLENQAMYLPGGRIQFLAAANPSADVNTLDDYEEGTWTPTIIGVSTAGAGTYSVQTGKYTKIGNKVYFQAEITWSAHTGTGVMEIGPLPFTATAHNVSCAINAHNITFTGQLCAQVTASTARISILVQATGAAIAAVTLDTAGSLVVSGHYYT